MPNRRKLFTVDEANELLPKLSGIVERLKILKGEIDSRHTGSKSIVKKADVNGGHRGGVDYLSRLMEFHSCLKAITDSGCLLKDVGLGLIDFPSMRDGKEIYLCWKYGEGKVLYWHELDAGFSARRTL